jgi:thymidylate synthase (FAD)
VEVAAEYAVALMFSFYDALIMAGWRKEDARQFLPIGMASDIVQTANFREWRHIFRLRCDAAAHWEIRTIMRLLAQEFAKRWPIVFGEWA